MFINWDVWCMQLKVITNYVCFYILIFICLVIHLIIYVFAFFRWVVTSCKPYLSHTLLMIFCKSMFESFSFRAWYLDLLPVKCSYVMVDCSFSLSFCTENKNFSTIYYVLVRYEHLGIPLSDTGKSMVKKKLKGIHWLSSYYCHYDYYIRIVLIIMFPTNSVSTEYYFFIEYSFPLKLTWN